MSLHILDDLEQGSAEWHDARRGIVTASVVGKLITTGSPDAETVPCPTCSVETGPCVSLARKFPTLLKAPHTVRTAAASNMRPVISVADNDTSRGLTFQLAAERITGWTDETFMSNDMWRGVESEPIARDLYSKHHAPATEVGFMRRDEDGWTLGYSPDGLVGDDGLIEIKAPRAKTHISTVLSGRVPGYYMGQCQAGLLVSGRSWLDFVSYVGGLPLWVKRVHPDPDWFDAIEAACRRFEVNARTITTTYEAAVVGLPHTERVLEEEMSL